MGITNSDYGEPGDPMVFVMNAHDLPSGARALLLGTATRLISAADDYIIRAFIFILLHTGICLEEMIVSYRGWRATRQATMRRYSNPDFTIVI
jgi:hypothetical protein